MDELENPIGPIKEFVDNHFHVFMQLIKVCLSRLCHKHCSLAALYTVVYIVVIKHNYEKN